MPLPHGRGTDWFESVPNPWKGWGAYAYNQVMPSTPATQFEKPIARANVVDLYCLECGYNLRGLSGDPRRCPECFHMNPVSVIEVPAKAIARQLKGMETAPATCLGAILFLSGLLLFLLGPWIAGSKLYWSATEFISVVKFWAMIAFLIWGFGAVKFRRSCLAKPGWRRALLKYHLYGLTMLGFTIGVIGTMAWLFVVARGGLFEVTRGKSDVIIFVSGILAAVVVWMIVRGVIWAYRRAKADMESLQREVAVTLAREQIRRKMASPKR